MGKGSGCICYAKGSQSQTDISQASLRWLSRRECLCREKKTLFSEFLFNSNTETNRWRKTWFCKNVCITSWTIEWLSGIFFRCFLCPVLHQPYAFLGCCLPLNWAHLIRYISKKPIWQKSGRFLSGPWVELAQGKRDVGREEQGEKWMDTSPHLLCQDLDFILVRQYHETSP